jgi:hypothetical protein
MATNLLPELSGFVEQHIPEFHAKRLEGLKSLALRKVLQRKNPYLFRAKHVTTAGALVHSLLQAHLSSQEETLFGAFLEQLALLTCSLAYGGKKSSAEGIDLEFTRDGIEYIVSIKSGPNWGNSRQVAKMRDDFKRAKRVRGTNHKAQNVVAVNGCCYGQERSEDKGDYLKLCGQRFWELISGSEALYVDLIDPIGHQAKQRNEEFEAEFAKVENTFTCQFIDEFCTRDGSIDWQKLVRFNSGNLS